MARHREIIVDEAGNQLQINYEPYPTRKLGDDYTWMNNKYKVKAIVETEGALKIVVTRQ